MKFMDFINSTTNNIIKPFNKLMGKYKFLFSLLENNLFQRWAIGIVLCLLLALILAPKINFSAPQLKQGMIAAHDIKADRDFLVEDQLSTKQKKNDAAENIKPVYDFDSNISFAIRNKLLKSIASANEYYQRLPKEKIPETNSLNIRENQKAKKLMEMTLGFSLTSQEFDIFKDYRYSNELKQKLSRLISSIYDGKFITNVNFNHLEKEKGIIIRTVTTQDENDIKNLNLILNINEINPVVLKRINLIFKDPEQDVRPAVFSLTKKLIEPNLTFNKNATEKKKILSMDEVKPVFSQVQKNEMIVREGEKIGYLELAKLDAFFKSKGDSKFSGFLVFMGISLTALFLSCIMYLWRTRNWLNIPRHSNVDLLVFSIIIVLQILIIKVGIFISSAVNKAFPLISTDSCFFAIPFAFGAMIIAVLINRNVALIISVMVSFLIGFLFDEKIIFPLFAFLGSVAASYRIVNSRQRSAFLKIGIFLGIVNIAAIFCMNLLTGNLFNDLFLRFIMGFAGGIITGILVAGITPIFESAFGFITDIKLLELANLNQPLFQKMIIEAPGTYHHSIIVASLVEAAAEAIGANSLLAKVSAYYHDIGKLTKPQYFIENQPNFDNRHDKLSPKMSSLIIISHVKDGCELASQVKLGRQIINIIRQHHGNNIVSYFYDKAKKNKDESIRSLSESDFRYPGPKPQTKEAGLVMLGDVIEASSRTLSHPTPARIRSLVRERIERIYMDGQLDECELTLRNMNTIAETFTKILTGIFHHRVDYPESTAKETNGKKDSNENTNRKQADQN
jgi:putative nucleotidyltransferase with HDIG domain